MPDQRRARLSLYRSAYLLAFAMHGYALTNRVTYDSADSARAAFISPDDLSWTPPMAHLQNVDVAHRAVFAIDGPDEFADTIGVLLHGHVAVVPWITQPADFSERIHHRLADGNLTITPKIGIRLQWPTAPAHSLDLAVGADARRSWAAPPPE